jgi:Xaa-Pro aminopeptidase
VCCVFAEFQLKKAFHKNVKNPSTILNHSYFCKNKFMKKLVLLLSIISIVSCKTDTVKEKINKAGDVAGQTAGELMEGISKGVQKAFDVEVEIDEQLKKAGVDLGKTTIKSDSSGTDNLLVAYLIFNQNFKGKLLVTA